MRTSMLAALVALCSLATPAAAQSWFLPDVFPNHRLAPTHKLAGLETIGQHRGRAVYWLPTLESNYWSTGNWSRTLTYADESPCCWDFNQWRADGDRGRGGYFARPDADSYDSWIGLQDAPTFPIFLDEGGLPRSWILPGGTALAIRVYRPTDTLVGYLGPDGCCSPEPIPIAGGRVFIGLSLEDGRLKLEGWGVDAQGVRVGGGEAFYFCRACLPGREDEPVGGPVRWEVTDVTGRVTQQWTFERWVSRTARDVLDTARPEMDRLRRTVKEFGAEVATLRQELAECEAE